jgi:hypothetical protein
MLALRIRSQLSSTCWARNDPVHTASPSGTSAKWM